jgi:VWFA-related protein
VQLEVVVRDSHGRAVIGLSKDDFVVYDSGRVRDLTEFSLDTFDSTVTNVAGGVATPAHVPPESTTTQPPATQTQSPANSYVTRRWIALLFDDINTSPGDLAHAKIAAGRFVREAVAGGDSIGVFSTSGDRGAQFTSDTTTILAIVASVQSHPRTSTGSAQCPRMSAYEAYQIMSNDPTAMKAKVAEACHCGGQSCDVEAIPAAQLLNPTSNARGNAYEGGTLSTIIDSIRAQAEQTWSQTQQASQATLDSIKAILAGMRGKPGTHMLLLASSGFLSGTLDQEQDSIIDAAVRAGVVINALDAKGLYAEAPGGPINESNELSEIPVSSTVFQIQSLGDRLDDLDSAMARFTESTGGLLFRNNNDLDLGFHQVGLLPACTYLLGFTPAEDGKYHKIKVKLKNASHDFVQARPGYFAPTKATIDQPSPVEKTDSLMSGTDERAELPATISEKLGTTNAGGPQLTVQAHIDIEKLAFDQQKDRHVQKLTFIAALFDPQGNFVLGKRADMELALKPEGFDRFAKTGINGVMQLEVPPGTYRLRVVVQESLHGTFSAATKNLQIP